MNDIFISYASEDRSRVQRLAVALQQRGHTVWWDRQIPAGQSFDDVIERELTDSLCVIVAWSTTSVDSHWVREEAAVARERGVLVPVLLDNVAPPLGFGRIQAADLVAWNGDASAPEFERLLADVASHFNAHGKMRPFTGRHKTLWLGDVFLWDGVELTHWPRLGDKAPIESGLADLLASRFRFRPACV